MMPSTGGIIVGRRPDNRNRPSQGIALDPFGDRTFSPGAARYVRHLSAFPPSFSRRHVNPVGRRGSQRGTAPSKDVSARGPAPSRIGPDPQSPGKRGDARRGQPRHGPVPPDRQGRRPGVGARPLARHAGRTGARKARGQAGRTPPEPGRADQRPTGGRRPH